MVRDEAGVSCRPTAVARGGAGPGRPGRDPGAMQDRAPSDDTGPGPASRRGRSRRRARDPADDAAPGLPERLLAARERKGVDLYRAERDTKIRARYLAALERGDYRELPGAVYTKGFLRNYALYLGLDPDEVLLQWRRERGDPREPQAGHHGPAADRRAAQGPDLLAEPDRLRPADRRGARLRGLPRRPAAALREAAHDRRDDPAAAVVEVDEDATEYVLRGHDDRRAATISIARPRTSTRTA